jgi:hypothetical protein
MSKWEDKKLRDEFFELQREHWDKSCELLEKPTYSELEAGNKELKALIGRYIAHVEDCEGICFIDRYSYDENKNLSEKDRDVLRLIKEKEQSK